MDGEKAKGSLRNSIMRANWENQLNSLLTAEQFQGLLLGNVIKYSLRANFKGQFKRDVEKMSVYANTLRDKNEYRGDNN
jgi:hypothetical protein